LFLQKGFVAPHAGAWIETRSRFGQSLGNNVAPHAGTWIETIYHMSLRMSERALILFRLDCFAFRMSEHRDDTARNSG